jgi:hypothetical protein
VPERSRFGRLATAVLFATGLTADAAGPQPADRQAFLRQLDTFITAIATTKADGLEALASRVPPSEAVGGGARPIEVSYRFVLDEIGEARTAPATWPEHRDRLVARLTVMRDETAAESDARADIASAHAVLESVLARPEFARNVFVSAAGQLRDRIRAWFARQWERFVGRRVGGREVALVLAWIVAFCALAALASWVVRSIVGARATGIGVPPPPAVRKSSRAWTRDALAATDPREAVRCLYNAAISRLEEEGVWRADDTRTPREYVRLLPSGHRRRPIVEEVAGLFEQVWYRARPVAPDDSQRVARELEVLGCVRSGRVI